MVQFGGFPSCCSLYCTGVESESKYKNRFLVFLGEKGRGQGSRKGTCLGEEEKLKIE